MGLKFSDALRLSWSNIAEHKVRSLIIILTISVLFGIIMGLNFLINGLEKTALELSNQKTANATYIYARISDRNVTHSKPGIHDLADLPEFTIERNESEFNEIADRAQRFHGEVVGYSWQPLSSTLSSVVSASAVQSFITEDLSTLPAGKIPILLVEGAQLETFLQEYAPNDYERLLEIFYQVGTLPTVTIRDNPEDIDKPFTSPTLNDSNPLDLLLSNIHFDSLFGAFMIIDDDSNQIVDFIQHEAELQLTESNFLNYPDLQAYPIVKFDDPYDAVAFSTPVSFLGIEFYFDNNTLFTQDLLGGVLSTANSFNVIHALLAALEILFVIISILVAVFTFKSLIDQDANTIALYRAMGATTGNLYLIYFLYFLELCLLAIVATFIVATLFIGIIVLLNGSALSSQFQTYYQLTQPPHISYFVFDQYFWTVFFAILLVAPLALAFSTHRFKANYIAKKLKAN